MEIGVWILVLNGIGLWGYVVFLDLFFWSYGENIF